MKKRLSKSMCSLVLCGIIVTSFFGNTVSAADYVTKDLKTLGGNWSQATDINEDGQVVGVSLISKTSGSTHAFLLDNGVMKDLGSLQDSTALYSFSYANDVNDNGQVVGQSWVTNKNAETNELKPSTGHAFLWQNGTMEDLGTLGGNWSQAEGINNSGVVVGISGTLPYDGNPDNIDKVSHAFVCKDGQMTDITQYLIPYLPPASVLGEEPAEYIKKLQSGAKAINDKGQIAGFIQPMVGVPPQAVVWEPIPNTDSYALNVLSMQFGPTGPMFVNIDGRQSSTACDINENGQVVGTSCNYINVGNATNQKDCVAFIWQNGVMTSLGTIPVGTDNDTPKEVVSQVCSINEKGQVVGFCNTYSHKLDANGNRVNYKYDDPIEKTAFIWENGEMKALASDTSVANSINDKGQVVGIGGLQGIHACLWEYGTEETQTETPETALVYGDVNGDGMFDITDVSMIEAYIVYRQPVAFTYCLWQEAGDVNGDKKVDYIDYTLMKAKSMGHMSKFPVEYMKMQ